MTPLRDTTRQDGYCACGRPASAVVDYRGMPTPMCFFCIAQWRIHAIDPKANARP